MKIAAAILAGGRSRRMGQDKANLPSLDNADTTILQRTVELAASVFQPVYVVGRQKPDSWPASDTETVFLPDETPDLGPMGGLETALKALEVSKTMAVALIACDLPFLSVSALQWLYNTAQGALARHGSVVRNGQQIEPLFAVYTLDCLPLLTEQLARGKRSLQKLIEAGDFSVAEAPLEVSRTLVNVNTAEELVQARSLAATLREEISSSGAV